MYNEKQIAKYFERIKYSGNYDVSLENLALLQKCHLFNIPYETLDQMNGVPLSLTPEAVFEKIILSGRGGYCFETQGLLCYLLRSLGYDVVQYAGRFMNEPGVIQMRRHRILIVTLSDKRYLCDVGMRAETSRIPLELTPGLVQTDGVGEYRFEKDDFYGWVLYQRLPDKEYKPLYAFTEEVQIDDDFVMPSFYCEKHPDSPFNKIMKIAIYTPDSNLNIVDNEYKVYRMGKCVEEHTIKDRAEAEKLLWEKFGIIVPENYRLL
ncbi:MAG: arylamine N-acetyltransferase [Clostridia bacterium]|nr:arylamine N-acetyltransferase [Clostridia bacterium]